MLVFRVFNSSYCFFSGKILKDEEKLSEYKIDEKGFVVVMVTKVNTKAICLLTQ